MAQYLANADIPQNLLIGIVKQDIVNSLFSIQEIGGL